ncbi:MAG TPA: leucine-rich repeat domain-containing protein [Candidatus Gallimonas gallistercoris]|uniref:Leucine-rich repeat domain-containing protein n=1 Tax=Candidatus Gallimonas gallistercoris TaxID=2838602 RepID=A0A9D2KFT6_9FIRM|nr:leucine-rich repeat domain-containing protein [Candidatus Gallimonas gallistercoris]
MEHTHAYSSWVVVDEPTCTEEGLRERTYSCGEKETEQIVALNHTPGEAVRENEKAPTCTEKGSYEEVVYCTVCEEEVSRKTITVDALDHTPGEAVRENEVAATCTTAGSYEEVVYCTVCEEEEHTCSRCQETETQTIDALDHAWSAYSFDETNHWRECTRAGCSAKEEAKHSFTRNTCETCGYAFYSEGLLYEVNNDTDTVTITGEGTCSDTTIYIPAVIDEKPVTEIGNYAFLRCTSLKEAVIPQSVTSIGSSAFNYCTSLKEIVIPEGVISISNSALNYCTSLKEVVIPQSVTSIGDSAFDGCDELTTVYYRGSKEQWDSIIGSNKDALTGVQIICDYKGE